jgi:multicomponent K+:H+ antiporter subunit G
MVIEALISLAIIVGASLALIGSIGLVRLDDLYSRLHGPTKATTLGLGGLLVASTLHFSRGGQLSLHEVLVTAFLFLTAPASAHMVAKAALHLRVRSVTRPPRTEDGDAFPETAVTPPGHDAG